MDEPRLNLKRLSWKQRCQRAGWIALPLIPLILANIGTSKIPSGRPLSGSKQLSPLGFRQYAVNLHEVAPTATLTAPFAFWNRSERSIEITKLEPSCGCLAPRILGNRKEYGPGGQGLFEVQVETARETPGPHTYSVVVHYTSGDQKFEDRVTFRCEIPERNVVISPPELYFYQLSDTPIQDVFRVEDHRGKELKVVEAVSTNPHLTLNVGKWERIDEQTCTTPVEVLVGANLPAGTHHTFITVKTDDPDFPTIRVPVFLQGKPAAIQLTSGTAKDEKKQNSPRSSPPENEGTP